ncbi:MAG: NAD-dependent protein deacylase [Salinivirgaceae bacterium]|nr:NAD-dependent protein deacylase [Salinivirgaceae bacterium]
MKKKLVVLTGAGISAESGISTFRDSDGLWNNYKVEDVATPEGLERNPKLVLDFYNNMRADLPNHKPNNAHLALARLQQQFDVCVITQNVDDLHERAGSNHIIHLHGELTKVRSMRNENLITDIGYNSIKLGNLAADGAQLRPHIVFFGEQVPEIETAIPQVQQADIFGIIGTSLVVYPAAGLLNYAQRNVPIFVIDPKQVPLPANRNIKFVQKGAGDGMVEIEQWLNENYL